MYNFNPYGQHGQPVRPSYNLLFSHFKQLGYSDELAGAEANRIMIQANAYNQYTSAQGQNVQYNASLYQNVNYNAVAQANAGYNAMNNMYAQQVQTAVANNLNTQQAQTQTVPQAAQATTAQNTGYDKANLLSGVKISSKASGPFPQLNVQGKNHETQNNLIKIKLKSAPDPKTVSKGFHEPIGSQPVTQQAYTQAQTPPQTYVAQTAQAKYPPTHPLQPGYPVAQQVAGYPYNQVMMQPVATATMYQSAAYPTAMTKRGPNLSNVFYSDTKGKNRKKTQQAAAASVPMTIDHVNKWIQDLYVHLNMTTCSKKLRKAVNVYIQYILEKFRSGTLKQTDLKMLSADEIINFKPDQPSAETTPEKDDMAMDLDEKKPTPAQLPTPTKGKKKSKSKKSEEHVQKLKFDMGSKGLDRSEIQRREQRSQRFKAVTSVPVYNFNLMKNRSVVGQSQDLEKQYLRLTSEPNPLTVRPENVLVKSFKYVFDKFLNNRNYIYIQEQFRSIRQDIQVQHLRSAFVVDVYTTNARLALLHSDLDQFNQCQTQLRHLLSCFRDCQRTKDEFELYYILYLSLQNMNMDLLRYLKEHYADEDEDGGRTPSADEYRFRDSVYFKYANMVRLSILDENFIQYFKLVGNNRVDYDHYLRMIYDQAFNPDNPSPFRNNSTTNQFEVDSMFYCKLLFKMFEDKFRMYTLYTLCRSSLTLSLGVLVNLLNFADEDECTKFLRQHNAIFNESGLVDCKKTLSVIVESPLMRSKKI